MARESRTRLLMTKVGRKKLLMAQVDCRDYPKWRYHIHDLKSGRLLYTYSTSSWGKTIWDARGKRIYEVVGGVTYSIEDEPPLTSPDRSSWSAPVVCHYDIVESLGNPAKTYTTIGAPRFAGLQLWRT